MSNKTQTEQIEEFTKPEPVTTLTRDHIMTFKSIASSKTRLKLEQEAISDDVKGLAKKLGWSNAKVGSVISMMMKEQEKGGVIKETNEITETVGQILDQE